MRNGWSDERRARQAQAIKRWRPWERSTGPRTPEGKAASAGNSLVHGLRTRESIEAAKRISELLRMLRRER